MVAFDSVDRIELPPNGISFPSHKLLPEGIMCELEQSIFVVEAKYFQKEQLGFVIFEMDPSETIVCNTLRGLLSSALGMGFFKNKENWWRLNCRRLMTN